MSGLPAGYLLKGRYSIQRILGQGGFGITYLAYDAKLKIELCIKEHFMRNVHFRDRNGVDVQSEGTGATTKEWEDLFFKEAQRLAGYNQKNILRVRDMFRAHGTAYMVMDYIEGLTLKQYVTQHGPLTERRALRLFEGLLDAVETMHRWGHLHRDIKPSNVIITKDDHLILIDFGSSMDLGDTGPHPSRVPVSLGYAPLEQYKSNSNQGYYTDVYALGATLYFMLTGVRPEGSQHRYKQGVVLVAPKSLRPAIGSSTSAAVMRALQLQVKHRYPTVKDLRKGLIIHASFDMGGTRLIPKRNWMASVSNFFDSYRFEWVGFLILAVIVLLLYWFALRLGLGEPSTDKEGFSTAPEIEHFNCGVSKVSYNGHAYATWEYQGRCWFAENLRTVSFSNGDEIAGYLTDDVWSQTTAASHGLYENRWTLLTDLGRLYNGYAVKDSRGLCPSGWHVSTEAEWKELAATQGRHLDTFKQKLGGIRTASGDFVERSEVGHWWTDGKTEENGKGIKVAADFRLPQTNIYTLNSGLSVRCVKD
jgi:serine/threonine protein kinase